MTGNHKKVSFSVPRSVVTALVISVFIAGSSACVCAADLTAKQLYDRGVGDIEKKDFAQAITDFTLVIDKDPQNWKAWANRSLAKFHSHDYPGARQDMNVCLPHLSQNQQVVDLNKSIEQAMSSNDSQARDLEARRAMARRMLLNAQLGGDMSSPAYQITQLANTVMARGGKIPNNLVKPFPTDLVHPSGTSLITPLGGSNNVASVSGGQTNPFSVSSGGAAGGAGAAGGGARKNGEGSTASAFTVSSGSGGGSGAGPGGTIAESAGHASAQDYFNHAVEKSQKGDVAGAVKDYGECLKLDQKNAQAYANRGALRFNLNDINGALDDFNKACELAPDNPQFKFLRDKLKEAADQSKAAGH